MPSLSGREVEFAKAAIEAGSAAVVASSSEAFEAARARGLSAAWRPAGPEFFESVGEVCRRFFTPVQPVGTLVGITGTNGKTTTAWMLRDALGALDRKAAYIGTLGFRRCGRTTVLENTTPFPVELWNLLGKAWAEGCEDVVMEVSSHGLAEHRIAGVPFSCGVFTNLSQDHLDYHPSMQAYEEAKRDLFLRVPKVVDGRFVAVLNTDDPVGASWAPLIQRARDEERWDEYRIVTYGFSTGEVRGRIEHVALDTLNLVLEHEGRQVRADLSVGGAFNAQNALSAAATLVGLGYGLADVARALGSVTAVPGRFEAIANDRGIGVLVDYAHTPDALDKLLTSARQLNPVRLIAVFGCGGDRDKTKRPRMAEVVGRLADLAVVTSDNPRTEDPASIIADIEAGLPGGFESRSIVDRREAIADAIRLARRGDIVVIAGKGHEDYQIIGRTKHHMDDREMARDALEALP